MTKQKQTHQNKHHPVLLESVIELLDPQPGQSYLDMTAGYGGHAAEVIARIGDNSQVDLIDRDENAIAELKNRFCNFEHVCITQSDFATAAEGFASRSRQYQMILADIGVSSPHLDMPERGFSFTRAGPLDMRMDQHQATTAADIIKQSSADELATIIRQYGEEPQAKRIARAIKAEQSLATTDQLADCVRSELGDFKAKAALPRVFQAFRIAVNDELGQLERLLAVFPKLLTPGGRIAIISFHSLEDRLVKQRFKELSLGLEPELKLLTKKPIKGTTNDSHPRARSAMLRAAVKQT